MFVALALGGCASCENDDVTPSFPADLVLSLDQAVDDMMREKNLPGVLVGVWVPDEGVYVRAKGLADLTTGSSRSLEHPFRIASITKTYTALTVLKLHDEQRLDIDDFLSEYTPDFPLADSIRIKHLLNMNSGITDFADESFLKAWYENPLLELTMEHEMRISADKKETFYPAGQKVVYSNINYVILGWIIRQVTGTTIQEAFRTHIFDPLSLENTFYPYNGALPGTCRGYSWNETTENFDDTTVLNPLIPNTGGGVISTLADLRRFARALYRGELLSEETHEKQLKAIPMDGGPQWIRYGLGIIEFGGFWGHNVTIFGFSSEMFYLPQKDATIVVNVNRLDVDDHSQSTDLFLLITRILFPDFVTW